MKDDVLILSHNKLANRVIVSNIRLMRHGVVVQAKTALK
jgi:hypothetical protein